MRRLFFGVLWPIRAHGGALSLGAMIIAAVGTALGILPGTKANAD